MSWFDISADNLRYVVSSGGDSEVIYDGIAVSTFSSLGWWIYAISILGVLLIGYFIFSSMKKVEVNLGSYWKFAIVLSLVFCTYSAFFVLLLWDVPFGFIAQKMRDGTFGDSFGTLNTLFSGMAFAGVLITLLFQRKDLSETRAQIAHQQIESQFYSMLDLQQEVVRNFDLQQRGASEIVSKGRDCFKHWARWIPHHYDREEGSHEEKMAKSVASLIEKHKADLGLYFRSLYSVFRFVHSCEHKDRAQFGLVVRSLLSDYELIVLFYNSLSPRGEKFKRFIYEFALFDNLEIDLLLRNEDINLFEFQAYGSNRKILEELLLSPS
ncbi:hypothetical protein G7025_13770 [Pseudomonas lurida]|uniref:putative phage abortive infection protein n=1 Tax=Pseudomonas TaxID=286 RepID=UPI0015E3D2F7|nr:MULTISPECIES: putative phage abortive infection protein [Pseudomonas]MBA1294427.1 hypothetical protein [Pseudomonas lurida]